MYSVDECIHGSKVYDHIAQTQVIAIASGKGGVGKTTIAVNLSISLSQLNNRVLLFDGDLSLANANIHLNVNPKRNISHAIRGICCLTDIIYPITHNLSLIAGVSGDDSIANLSLIEYAGIVNLFSTIHADFDYMIIDTASGISARALTFLRSSQRIIVVVCDEPTSLYSAYSLIKIMSKSHGHKYFQILANNVIDDKDGINIFMKITQMAESISDVMLSYAGAICYDKNVWLCIKQHKQIILEYPQSKVARDHISLARRIMQWRKCYGVGANTQFFLTDFTTMHKVKSREERFSNEY